MIAVAFSNCITIGAYNAYPALVLLSLFFSNTLDLIIKITPLSLNYSRQLQKNADLLHVSLFPLQEAAN